MREVKENIVVYSASIQDLKEFWRGQTEKIGSQLSLNASKFIPDRLDSILATAKAELDRYCDEFTKTLDQELAQLEKDESSLKSRQDQIDKRLNIVESGIAKILDAQGV